MWPYCIYKPLSREFTKRRRIGWSYKSRIFLVNWWFNGVFCYLLFIGIFIFIIWGIFFLVDTFGHTTTWTVIDKDTGIKYENAITITANRVGACTHDDQRYPIFWNRSDNDDNIKDGSITMSVDNKEITITHFDKIDQKSILTKDYCNGIK